MRAMGAVKTSLGVVGANEQGDGPRVPVLFLHGVGSDKSVWHPQLGHFGRTRRAIAIDYPGYGESAFVADATRDDYARSALAVLDALGIARAHVCGLSLGGVVAIAMHALAPERCASLVLADTFAVHPDGQAIYDRSVNAADTIGMRALAEARAGALLGSDATTAMRDEVVATMSRIDPAAYKLGARAVWLADQQERVASIDVPTLVVCGDEDAITPPALSHALRDAIPGARYVEIAKAGHLANLEQPDAFNSALDAFFSESDEKA